MAFYFAISCFLDTEIQAVYHVPVFDTPETKQYDLTTNYGYHGSEQYNTILKFKDFEIWPNFTFNQTRGDIFSNDLFTKIFAIINLEYTGNYQSFMKYDKLIRLKFEDPSDTQ